MWRRLARSSATAARRSSTAARVAVSRPLLRLPQASSSCLQPVAPRRAFGSLSDSRYEPRGHDVKIRDIALRELVRRPWVELQEFYGPVEMSKVRQTLPLAWMELSGDSAVAPEVVEDFYEASMLCRLPKLQRDVFSYMETHYLDRVSFKMYGQIFTNLTTAKDPQRMRAIFERALTRYDREHGQIPPEIIYRLGISAAIGLNDFVGVKTLMREMEMNGVKPSVEIVSRVMVAQANKGDVKTVLAAAEKLNPQDERKWHEADINRVITSLGIAGEPDAAFDFYRRSQIRLSPQTLMKLMLVCRGNSRPKHALAILANRRRFGLKMLPAQYLTLLEIIEELGIGGAPTNEMALILKEMRENGVRFNDRVHAFIARNQHILQGTPFMLTPPVSDQSDGIAQVDTDDQPRARESDMPLLRELLDTRKFPQAAAIVDSYAYVQQDSSSLGEEVIIVPAWIADIAVEAYSQNQEIDKVRGLLRGFLKVRGEVKHALSRIVGLFGGKSKLRDNRLAYEAFLAMQFQNFRIYRVRDALTRFKHYDDAKASLELLKQVSEQISEALQDTNILKNAARHREDFMRTLERSGTLNFDPTRAVRDVLRILVGTKKLDLVGSALDILESDGIPVRAVDFEYIFGAMSKVNDKNDEPYLAEDFIMIWEDMTRRNVMPSKAVLRLVVPVLCVQGGPGDDKRWKRAAIEGYHQAVKDQHDNYVLPIACFSMLLQAAAETGSVVDVNAIHAGAVKALGATMNKKHHSLADHSNILETWNAIKSAKAAAERSASYGRVRNDA